MRTKAEKNTQKHNVKPKKPHKPTIPNDILKVFLDRNVTREDVKNITQVKDEFLWEKNGVERYRVNIWMEKRIEGAFCNRIYIGYTWFLHYNRKEQTIADKTLGRVESEEISKKSKVTP